MNTSLWKSQMGVVAIATIAATMAAIAADWPQWRGPNGNGVSSETNWFKQWPPKELWRIHVGSAYGGLVVSEGRMYTTGWSNNQDWVHCHDAVSGERVWSYPFCHDYAGYRGPFSTPAVAGDHVYAVSKDGEACCLNRHTGELVWSKTFVGGANGYGVSGSPIVDGDKVYFAAGGACVAVNRTAPYDVLWTSPAVRSGYSSPVVFTHGTTRMVAVVTERLTEYFWGALVAIDASTGETAFAYPFDAYADPVVVGDGDSLFLSSVQRGVILNLTDFSEMQAPDLINDTSTSILADGCLYALTSDGYLKCASAADGSLLWSEEGFDLWGEGGIAYADGKLIVMDQCGRLGVVEPTFSPSPTATVVGGWVDLNLTGCLTPPVLAQGRIYCRGSDGTVVCLDVGHESDGDNDGISDSWEERYFASTNNFSPTGNADADAYDNLQEFVAGTDPTNGQSVCKATITVSNGSAVVSCPMRAAEGVGYLNWTRYYGLESTTNLTNGVWEVEPGFARVRGEDRTFSFTNRLLDRLRFYRIRVTLE